MKKFAIIAMCCITMLFAACNKEKPNEKFIGDWYGSGLANGTMSMNILGQEQVNEFNDIAIPMDINLAAGEAKNEVILTYTSEEMHETYTTKGIIDGYNVDFDPIDINMTVQGTTIKATLDLMGALSSSEDILSLNGTVNGQGSYAIEGYSIPYTATGTVTADLRRGTSPTPTPTPYEGPTMTLVEDENLLSEGAEVVAGEFFFIGLAGEGQRLLTLTVAFVSNGNVLEEWTKELGGSDEFTCTKYFTLDQVGDVTMTATLTDTQDKTAVVTVHFKVVPAPEPEFGAHYAGTVTMDATASAFMVNYPISMDYDMDILLSEAAEEGRVNATITFAGNTYTTTGTKDDNAIDLEPFDIVLDYEGSTVNGNIDMAGTINGTVFSVQGALTGSGNITFSGMSIPATIEGTVAGDLDEVE